MPDRDDEEREEAQEYEREEQARLFDALTAEAQPFAERVSQLLVEQLHDHERRLVFEPLRQLDRPTADIEDNLEKLHGQLREARLDGRDRLTCAPIGNEMIPLSTEELWRQQPSQSITVPEDRLRWTVPIEHALAGVKRQLSDFLARRLAGSHYFAIRGLTGGMGSTRHMLAVTVHSRTIGARVSYSPSYFVNYVALAAPTTPVRGMLDPGRYIFMLTSPGPLRITDNQVFDVPPSFDITLMV